MKTISEIRKEGIHALTKTLGPVDMARFIQSYETGTGDYTRERKQWLEKDFDTVIARIKERRKKKSRA